MLNIFRGWCKSLSTQREEQNKKKNPYIQVILINDLLIMRHALYFYASTNAAPLTLCLTKRWWCFRVYLDQDSSTGQPSEVGSIELLQGGVYSVSISKSHSSSWSVNTFKLTDENSVHMLWLMPQYLVITIGETFFAVSGLEFSYSQVKQDAHFLPQNWLSQ